MIQSMTGYANFEKTESELTVKVEIRSYNSRYLDIVLRVPRQCAWLEDSLRNIVSKQIARGRIEISMTIEDRSDKIFSFEINEAKTADFSKTILDLKQRFNIDVRIPFDFLTGAGGIIKSVESEKDKESYDKESYMAQVEDSVNGALAELIEMRKREGAFIAEDIAGRLGIIEKYVEQLDELSDNLWPYYHERLKERIDTLTKGCIEIEPDRIAQEAALLANKSDVSEEIVRIKSHIKQFNMIMSSGESAGRKLNFLIQEFNREFNTIGSKTEKSDVSHLIVEAKSELEKIREQVQNVE